MSRLELCKHWTVETMETSNAAKKYKEKAEYPAARWMDSVTIAMGATPGRSS